MIWPAPKLVYVADDGDNNHFLKIKTEDGQMFAWPLDIDRILTLTRELNGAGKRLVNPPKGET